MMDIDGTQQKQLREALLSAFPTRQDLELMVHDRLNVKLASITTNGTLEYTVFELVEWAMARGRLEELVIGAIRENGQNPHLKVVTGQLKIVTGQLGLETEQPPLARYNESRSQPSTRERERLSSNSMPLPPTSEESPVIMRPVLPSISRNGKLELRSLRSVFIVIVFILIIVGLSLLVRC